MHSKTKYKKCDNKFHLPYLLSQELAFKWITLVKNKILSSIVIVYLNITGLLSAKCACRFLIHNQIIITHCPTSIPKQEPTCAFWIPRPPRRTSTNYLLNTSLIYYYYNPIEARGDYMPHRYIIIGIPVDRFPLSHVYYYVNTFLGSPGANKREITCVQGHPNQTPLTH